MDTTEPLFARGAIRLRSHSTWLVLSATMGASFLARIGIWRGYRGFLKGDDVEILEAALRFGAGLDYVPWEIRNLTLPLLLAPVSRALLQLGVTDRDALVDATVVPFILAGTLSILLTFELARRWSSEDMVALIATSLYAFHWLLLVYGSAPFPRVFATTAVLGGALALSEARADEPGALALRGLVAGALAGLAFSIRYSEALFLVPLLAMPFLRRPRAGAARQASMVLVGFASASCLLVGVVDWIIWGTPFSSLWAFLDYTLIERDSSSIEAVQPPWWYFRRLLHWLPLTALPLLWYTRRRRAMVPCWLFVAWPILGLSLIHHKELRYLQAVWPFVAILVASGAAELLRRRRAVAWTLVVATLVLGASRVSMVQKRSMAALEAAHYLGKSASGPIALSQSWAYGHRLFVEGRGIIDLGLPPTEKALRELPRSVQAVGLYEESLERSPELHEVLAGLGFRRTREFRRSRSEPVVVYERPRASG